MGVRRDADWMVQADDRLLEYLDYEGPGTPTVIARDSRINYTRNHVNMRLLELEKYCLVEKDAIGRGVYSITDVGRRYLTGDLDASGLEASDE